MFAKERQDYILEMLRKSGAITVSDLVKHFSVSIETIRRDLLAMEQRGLLSRVHGGAVTNGEMKRYPVLKERCQERSSQKKELSQTAMSFISEGDIVGIDAGSTAVAFAQVLKEHFSKLIVVTYSKDVFDLLCDHEDFTLILCGGFFMREENAFYGVTTIDTLSQLHIQKLFLFPSAISLQYGVCDYEKDLLLVQRQLLKITDEVFILADSSKFEKKGLLKLDDMRSEHTFITDSGLSPELQKVYRDNYMKIVCKGEKQR